ncbi:MAG: hypothetical protein NVSMB56_15450 [Pyrinomonadaceae bacterium]
MPVASKTGNANSPTQSVEATITHGNQNPTVTLNDPLVNHTLDGKYELTGRLGEGGMGAVYRARRVHIGDEVAVKVLHPKFVDDESSMERFRREARAAAQLHHRNVVTIHDYGEARNETDAPAYIVMELVDGVSLRDILRKQGKLPAAQAVKLMRDICAGVAAAHRHGIVHRDLKPDNVIVTDDPDTEGEKTVKVVDFGIAKLRDKTNEATLTQVGMVVGTPFYMSPEQCRGEHLDARADVYSLAAMFYEMLAGQPPFVAPNVTGVVAKHLTEDPPPLPPEINAPPALQNFIRRALSKDPNSRPADAAAFAREMQSAMDETIVSSRQVTNVGIATNNLPPHTPQTGIAANPVAQQMSPQIPKGDYRSAQPNAVNYNTPETLERARQAANYQTPLQYDNARHQKKSSRGVWLFLGLGAFIVFGLVTAIGLRLLLVRSPTENRNERENRNGRVIPSPQPSLKPSVVPSPAEVAPLPRAESKIYSDALLTNDDLNGIAPNEFRFLRNAVYARHGRVFSDPDLQRYFNTRAWYKPNAKYSDASLTANDRANVSLIKAIEDGTKPQTSGVVTPPLAPVSPAAMQMFRRRKFAPNAREFIPAITI